MSHSLNRIWIHSVWSTKDRFPFLDTKKKIIIDKLYNLFQKQECSIQIINGTTDHIHCLYLLNPNKSNSEILKTVKGSSSHWINQNDIFKAKFSWQVGFASFSVSESIMPKVKKYIIKQEEHHKKMSFWEEWNLLLGKHTIVVEGNH